MEKNEIVDLPEKVEVVGVRFRQTGKIYKRTGRQFV